jgi:hypothetical protein
LSHAQVDSAYPGVQRVLELPAAEPRVSVVISALKEARNLPQVFSRLLQNIFEVILVDGVPSTTW